MPGEPGQVIGSIQPSDTGWQRLARLYEAATYRIKDGEDVRGRDGGL